MPLLVQKINTAVLSWCALTHLDEGREWVEVYFPGEIANKARQGSARTCSGMGSPICKTNGFRDERWCADAPVVGIRELLRPFRITMPNSKAESVIELPAHSIFRSRTQIGDQLLIERYEPKRVRIEESDAMLGGPPKSDDFPALVSRGPVVPIAPQRVPDGKSRVNVASKVN